MIEVIFSSEKESDRYSDLLIKHLEDGYSEEEAHEIAFDEATMGEY